MNKKQICKSNSRLIYVWKLICRQIIIKEIKLKYKNIMNEHEV